VKQWKLDDDLGNIVHWHQSHWWKSSGSCQIHLWQEKFANFDQCLTILRTKRYQAGAQLLWNADRIAVRWSFERWHYHWPWLVLNQPWQPGAYQRGV